MRNLIEALKLHGNKIKNGYEYHFNEQPIIAVSGEETPYDAVINSVNVEDGVITLIAEDKEYRGDEHEIDVDNVFAGHLEFVTDAIYAEN